MLSEEHIAQVCCEIGHTWAARLLDPIVTIHVFILQVLYGNTAMTQLPRLAGRSFTPAAYCRARQRLPLGLLHRLLRRLIGGLPVALVFHDGVYRGLTGSNLLDSG